MRPETLSSFFSLTENKFFWTGVAAVAFYVIILDTKIGDAMFGNWIDTVTHINSLVIWAMVLLSGRKSLEHFSKSKKKIDSTLEGEEPKS